MAKAELRLGDGADQRLGGAQAARGAEQAAQPARGREFASTRLTAAVDGYARAFADGERMRTAGLSVLPHQEVALARAGERLEAADRTMAGDLRSALEWRPELAGDLDTREGRAALMGAVAHERRVRETPELRAERYVETWTKLKAERDGLDDWGPEGERRKAVEGRMRGLTGAIKCDPQAESVMKARAKELGIGAGSRLERVLEAGSEREALRLVRSLGHGLSR